MFDWFYSLLGMILSFFNNICGNNYLLAIVLFALLFKIILFPFSIKQQKNSVKQAKLRPKEMAIKKKYKGREDQDSKLKMQQEIQEMYKQEGYSPFSGCLPMLLQLPIIFALYEVIRNPLTYITGAGKLADITTKLTEAGIELKKNITGLELVDWLKQGDNLATAREHVTALPEKISELPNFEVFGINFGTVPSEGIGSGGWGLLWLLIPVLTFVFAYGSMKITRRMSYQPEQDPGAGCSMKVMDFVMPLMSAYFAVMWPSLMGIYWMLSNVLSVVQQFILKKMYPLPVFTEQDYKDAERQYRGKAPKNRVYEDTRVVPGKQYRSLHHIDDEDDETAPQLPPMKIDEDEEESTLANSLGDAPKLKDDNPEHRQKKNKKDKQ
ncbi:MAG: YidC/Oxa1 family membrane protein insertase [Clostridia bacterium]|nr:YidC/Oxa1 family membrane protein insertase [Clostridia bacterium]